MGAHTWPNLLSALLRGEELSGQDTAWAMGEIMAGDATPVQVAGLAVALRAKGETPAEIAGLVEAMLANATPVELPEDVRAGAVDVVGTGGDRANTVNISTMAAIIVAAAGVTVVKHGNRSASSACGTADLLEHFGIPLDLGPAGVARTVADAGIGFCFAARFHPGMRHAAVTRRELAVPTFFNMLGPLTNPARPRSAAVGTRCWSCAARTVWTSSRRPRPPGCGSPATARSRRPWWTPWTSACRVAPRAICGGRTPPSTRTSPP